MQPVILEFHKMIWEYERMFYLDVGNQREKKDYKEYSDELLVRMARDGDEKAEDFLLKKYKDFVRSKARAYFLVGGDSDDLIQEGMIGLYNAVLSYNPEKNSFKTFACLCITRRILTLLKTSSRQKHIPLNAAFSLDSRIGDNGCAAYIDCLEAPENTNPEKIVISNDAYIRRLKLIKSALSGFEKRVLHYLMEGLSYKEISECMHKDAKSI